MAQAYFNARAYGRSMTCRSDSAGIAAFTGLPASANAVDTMQELYQIDLSSHLSKPVSASLILQADLVLAMTPIHRNALQEAFPEFEGKIFTLSEYARKLAPDVTRELPIEIKDPYGDVLSEYKATIRQIASLVDVLIEHLCR
jgi:protein-tyrosine-phosphatase